MGLKCSVFGHDYADYDVERDRADHGAEVVTTVRTTEICRKCGDARVVSENTEIAAASAATPTPTPATAADGSRENDRSDGRDAADGASPADGGGRLEPPRERADDDRDTEGSETHVPRSNADGFEFDVSAGDDHDPGTSGSVGPTTAHATSRSLAESELRCGACGFAEPMLGSPLRAGDSCPQCSRGYLARRTRKE